MGRFRPLDDRERAVLDALLRFDAPDADVLRLQAATARARRSCACGCPTIEFSVDAAAPRAARDYMPWPVDGNGTECRLDAILFVRDGMLTEMEAVPHDDDPPSDWPDPSEFEFYVLPR